jgi:glycosyltransferase involved in cell wall biosynthesis
MNVLTTTAGLSCASGLGKSVCMLTSAHEATEDRILAKECQSLVRAGYKVSIIAPHPKDEIIFGIPIKALPQSTGRASRISRTLWHLYREAIRQRADIYHLHDPELILVGMLLKMRGKSVFYDVREDLPADILDKYWINPWLRVSIAKAAAATEFLAGRLFDGIVAATPHIAERFPKMRTRAIQNFPILDESDVPTSVPYRERPPLVLYFGGITAIRGVREMVDGMAFLPEGLQARLAIAGCFAPAELETELRQQAGWSRVDYVGWQARPGLLDLLSQARVGVVPYLPAANHTDCQPIKLFEFMRAGLPVVVSNLTRLTEIVTSADCGLVVDATKPQEIANAIQWLLEHPMEAELMGARGRKAVLDFYNWHSQAQDLLVLYRRIQR